MNDHKIQDMGFKKCN